jgi:hypothetical protein
MTSKKRREKERGRERERERDKETDGQTGRQSGWRERVMNMRHVCRCNQSAIKNLNNSNNLLKE